jgi:alkylation response protein AidB-like acyl-CoA dehydrogenase
VGSTSRIVAAMTTTLTTTTDSTTQPAAGLRNELPTEMLERFRSRAGALDRANAYFEEDLAELRSVGYLAAAVPTAFGGWGLDLAQMSASQRRLARYAPATALAMSMHSYWIGIVAELER